MIDWTLKTFDIDALTDYYKNPRSLTKAQFAQLKTSLDKFGMIDKPIVNLDAANTVIGGHQRLHVLRAEGVKTVECWTPARELDAREVEELNIRLNKNTGAWDFDILANQWAEEDLLEWGFEDAELKGLDFGGEKQEDPGPQIDKAEELRVKWGVELGQLWRLGEHRLICGDCTDRAVVDRVMGGEKAGAVVTDPPYNVGIEYGSGVNDAKTIEENEKFISKWFVIWKDINLKIITPGAGYYMGTLRSWMTLFPPRWLCIWLRKNSMSHSPLRGFAAWEPVLFYDIEEDQPDWGGVLVYGKVYKPVGQDVFDVPVRVQADVADGAGNKLHPTPKPVELFDTLLSKFTKPGDIVADPFLGSGTTLIACERLGRKCRAVEISPGYVAVSLQRWVDMTGGTPELLYNGEQHG